jgi:glycosyltransferase involved in cell wall biosynthesis
MSRTSDAAVVQGHAANDFFAHGAEVPTVIDLYDPYIVENLHYYAERGPEVFQHDHATLMSSLLGGDFFLCASETQRLFYLGLMLAVGRLNPLAFADDPHLDQLVGIAPFGVQPPRARSTTRTHDVLFGGIYDWYDPVLAIEAVALARKSVPDVTLTFTLHPNPELTPQGKTAEAIAEVKRRGYGSFVRFEPWFAYEERGAFFDRFALALLTFPQSLETELSMRTRVYDYLWGGLPIITSSAPGTDEIIQRYNAGTIVEGFAPEPFAEAVVTALRNDRLDALIAGTSRFVAGQQWADVLQPLRDFCRNPRVDRHKKEFSMRPELPPRKPTIVERLKRRIGGGF